MVVNVFLLNRDARDARDVRNDVRGFDDMVMDDLLLIYFLTSFSSLSFFLFRKKKICHEGNTSNRRQRSGRLFLLSEVFLGFFAYYFLSFKTSIFLVQNKRYDVADVFRLNRTVQISPTNENFCTEAASRIRLLGQRTDRKEGKSCWFH